MLSKIRQITRLLTQAEKRRFSLLTIALVVMGIFEVLGIASILPFIQLIATPEIVEGDGVVSQVFQYFNFQSHRQFVIFAGITSLSIIILSNLFKIFVEWYKFTFLWQVANRLSVGLLSIYTQKPYPFYLQSNTKDLASYIITEIAYVAKGVISSLVELLGRLIVATIILLLLLWVNVKIAVVMFATLGSAYLIIYQFQRRRLSKLGEERIAANMNRYRSMYELFDGIKTIKVYNKEALFYRAFETASKGFCDVQPRYHLTLATPRFVLEILAFGSMIGVVLYLYLQIGSIQEIIPTLSLYAIAGYKLLPALQSAFVSLGSIRHNWPSVVRLYPDLKTLQNLPPITTNSKLKPILLLQQLELIDFSFTYEEAEEPTLSDINLKIESGETIALVGSTGSGKTTLVDLLVGLLEPDAGQFKIDGKILETDDYPAWRKSLSYVPQDVFLFDDTILRNISLAISEDSIDLDAVKEAAKLAGIHNFIASLPQGYATIIGEKGVRLSGGQRQRLGLARALYSNPSLLILDEATSALDNVTEKGIVDALANLPRDITTILIAHRLTTVQRADRIYLLDQGRIIESGTYDELLHSSTIFKEMVRPR